MQEFDEPLTEGALAEAWYKPIILSQALWVTMVDVVKRVMIVDDSANVRQILQMSLVQAGYDVVEAIDGEDALRRFTENNVDMLVTDLKCFDFFWSYRLPLSCS